MSERKKKASDNAEKLAEESITLPIRAKQLAIQNELKAPRSKYNSFGNYWYRSCEDILEAVKPLCVKYSAVIDIKDDLVLVGDRHYVKSTAKLTDIDTGESVYSTAFAREAESKKGMDASQVTGLTSSYARKYALNGLLCIDDTKDADTDEAHKASRSSSPEDEPLKRTHKDEKSGDPEAVEALLKRLECYRTIEELNNFSRDCADQLAALGESDKATIRNAYYERQRALR
jgi:hypothetical protein